MAETALRHPCNRRNRNYAFFLASGTVLVCLIFSYRIFARSSKPNSTLLLASIVFRHGDRTPTSFYPNDPYKDPDYWPDGMGALTKKGKEEIFELGKFLRKRYDGYLPETYFPEDVYMMSSDNDRCLMSAQVLLAGLYPPVEHQIWNKHINWQPIPVHTVPRNLDKLIVVKKPCPVLEKEINRTYQLDFFKKIDSDNSELYEYLTKESGKLINNVLELESLYNTLEIEFQRGLKLPRWTETVFNRKMKDLAGLSLAAFTFTKTSKRLKGGPILSEIIDHSSKKIKGSLKPMRKLYLYSAHDLTLVSVLRALGFEELFKPDYGASLIFELHETADGLDHTIELLYLNDSKGESFTKLQIPGCEYLCKVKNFIEITAPFVPKDWEAECIGKKAQL